MILDHFPGIKQLSKHERMVLYCELQDRVLEERGSIFGIDGEILVEINERMKEVRTDSATQQAWFEVRARLLARMEAEASIPL